MKTGRELAEFAKKVLSERWLYRFGSYGERRNGIRRSDCYGIRKACSWDRGDYSVYVKSDDRNAHTAYTLATVKGGISKIPETVGLLVGKVNASGRVYHAGVYIGKGEVIDIYKKDYPARLGNIADGWSVYWQDTSIDYGVKSEEKVLFAIEVKASELNLRFSPSMLGIKSKETAKKGNCFGISDVRGSWGRIQNSPLWITLNEKYIRKGV